MKKILIFSFLFFSMSSFAEAPDCGDGNGAFWSTGCDAYYLKQNVKHLSSALKSFTTASKAWDSCPARVGYMGGFMLGNRSDQDLMKESLKDRWGNLEFLKIDTEKFYKDEDQSKLKCSMDVSLILANYPKELREKHVAEKVEDGNMEYWSRWGIAARWKIAADSLKECGIKISRLDLTTMQKVGSWANEPPDIDFSAYNSNGIVRNDAIKLLSPLKDRDGPGKVSLKVVYVRDIKDLHNPEKRGEDSFSMASSLQFSDQRLSGVFMKREEIYSPIRPDGLPDDNASYVTEVHEAFHILTGEGNASHVKTNNRKDGKFDVMSTGIMNGSGTFTEDQCDRMVKKGSARGFLKCD